MDRVKWRHQYDAKVDEAIGKATETSFEGEESKTQQSFAKDADLNEIVRRYGIGVGDEMPIAPVDPSFYGEVSAVNDLRTVLDVRRQAVAAFNALPPKLRERFHNDPAKLHEFVTNPDNLEESFNLGLLKRPKDRRADAPKPQRRQSDLDAIASQREADRLELENYRRGANSRPVGS